MKYIYRIPLSLLLLVFAGGTQLVAQAEQAVDPHGMERILGNTLVWVIGIVIAMVFGAILYVVNLLMEAQKLRMLQEHGIEVLEKAGLVQKESWWKRLNKQAWKLIPMEKEKDILFDHEYDGIRELDNSLPPWWVAMFYVTIAFGGAYLIYYHATDYGVDQATEYALEMERAEEAVQAYLAKQADQVDENNVVTLEDPKEIALGETIYTTYCVACHGTQGEGGVGPNLTDPYWIHGGSITDVFKTIKYGVPEKGMIAWNTQLRPAEIQKVASFIMTLVGTEPPNPKEPQGEIYEATSTDASTSTEKKDDAIIGMNQ
ncbi:MAG: c-type cytochrome [Saprospiraceae bacterium]|nr:c-type cytochrome [Saprospiraceae bacterium]